MLTWGHAIIAAVALFAGAGIYVWVRWHRARSALRAIGDRRGMLLRGGGVGRFVGDARAGSIARETTRTAYSIDDLTLLSPTSDRGYGCGVERWPVKTLSDIDADKVSVSPVRTTVAELLKIPRPQNAVFSQDHRVAPVELTTYEVRALAVKFQGEEDHDIHVIIVEPADFTKSMVTEVVDPGCDGAVRSRARLLLDVLQL